jgi:Zn-dependent peptidase ImmA (M78 family)
MDSWSLWDPADETAFVFLRSAATPERRRFRLAYELGHLARFISGGFRSLRDIGDSKKISSAFAAALLMPEEAAREAAHALGIGPDDWNWELLIFEKTRFGISAETFLYRISELGMISTSLFKSLRAKLKDHYSKSRMAGSGGAFEPRLSTQHISLQAGLTLCARVATTANRRE